MNPSQRRKAKTKLYKHQNRKCALCGNRFKYSRLTLDHIIAKVVGGTDSVYNLQLLCRPCNLFKGARNMQVAMFEYAKRSKQ